MKNNKWKRIRNQAGLTLIELSLVLTIFAIVTGGLYYVYVSRIYPAAWASTKYNQWNSVYTGLKRCAVDRHGSFPSGSGAIASPNSTTENGSLTPYVGTNAKDIVGWNYNCANGGTVATITVVDSSNTNSDAQDILVSKINNSGDGALSAVTTDANTVTVTINGMPCA